MELLQTVIFDYLLKAYNLRKNNGIENWVKIYSYEELVAYKVFHVKENVYHDHYIPV